MKKASCERCGEIEIDAADIVVDKISPAEGQDFHQYRFACPLCKYVKVKYVEGGEAILLKRMGCTPNTIAVPQDQPNTANEPFTENDAVIWRAIVGQVIPENF